MSLIASPLSLSAEVLGLVADVGDRSALEQARDAILAKWGRVDALLNGAGGNQPGATITPDKTFDDLDFSAFKEVVDLNLHGTVLPTLVFTPALLASGSASIVNYSSASAARAITGVVGYSAAKAAVDLGKRTKVGVRVNARVPGFFLGEQNRRLLTNEDGSLTSVARPSAARLLSVVSARPRNSSEPFIISSRMHPDSSPAPRTWSMAGWESFPVSDPR